MFVKDGTKILDNLTVPGSPRFTNGEISDIKIMNIYGTSTFLAESVNNNLRIDISADNLMYLLNHGNFVDKIYSTKCVLIKDQTVYKLIPVNSKLFNKLEERGRTKYRLSAGKKFEVLYKGEKKDLIYLGNFYDMVLHNGIYVGKYKLPKYIESKSIITSFHKYYYFYDPKEEKIYKCNDKNKFSLIREISKSDNFSNLSKNADMLNKKFQEHNLDLMKKEENISEGENLFYNIIIGVTTNKEKERTEFILKEIYK